MCITQGTHLLVSYVPEGNQARIHFWSVHRDPRYFTHPTQFWPERWLIADGLQPAPPSTQNFVHNTDAFIPFSYGPANCVGKNLAMQELRLFVCHFVQNLRVEIKDGWDPALWEASLEDKYVTKIGCLPAVVHKRE